MESGGRPRKPNLSPGRALTRDSRPRPVWPFRRDPPLHSGWPTPPASAPTVPPRGTGSARSEQGQGLPKWAQLCKRRLNSPRPGGGPSRPLGASRAHIPQHGPLPSSPRRRRPEPAPRPRTPPSPGRGAELAASRVAAAQYRGAQSPPPGAQCARRSPHSGPGAPLGHLAAPSAAFPARIPRPHSPAPRPSPLRPGRSRFPAPPSSALAQEAPPRPPPRNPPSPPPP